jgi:hypothetical protein
MVPRGLNEGQYVHIFTKSVEEGKQRRASEGPGKQRRESHKQSPRSNRVHILFTTVKRFPWDSLEVTHLPAKNHIYYPGRSTV